MKVLHIHFGKEGGAERFFVNLAGAFAERGVEQRFVIRPGRTWEAAVARHGAVWLNNYRYLSLSSLLLERRVAKMVRDWRPEAVMAWMPRAARLIPDVSGPVRLTRLGDYPAHLRHFRHCDVLVGNQPGIAVHCEALGWTGPTRTISNFAREVAPVPVSRAAHGTPEDAFLICGAGRLVHRKGMDLLIRAAAGIPGAWLWIVGEGKERPALEALAEEHGIASRTRFVGWVDEPIHHLAAADAVGMPSRHEPLGNVVLEAWQAGTPVVSTRSEGPSWYMIDGENGALVDIDALEDFTDRLRRLRDDPALGARFVEGGRARLGAMFSKEAIVDQYLDLFARGPAA